jgi:CBS domain-containing protein
MNVGDVMSKDILKISPDESVLDAGELMESKNIGSAMVLKDGEFLGVISKETFVSNLSNLEEVSLDQMKVSNLMEEDIDVVKADDDLKKAVELFLLQKNTVDLLPVVAEEEVVGSISLSNMVSVFRDELSGRFKISDLMHYNPTTVYDYHPLDEVVEDMKSMGVRRVLVLEGEKLIGIITIKDISLAIFAQKKEGWEEQPRKSSLCARDVMSKDIISVKAKDDAGLAAKLMIEHNIGSLPVVGDGLEGLISREDLLKGYEIIYQ